MSDTPHDPETGELEKPLSVQASEKIERIDYWRSEPTEALISFAGPEFLEAFMAVQKKVGGIMENNREGYGYKYTDLAAVVARVINVMHEHNLILQQCSGKVHGIAGSSKALLVDTHTKVRLVPTNQYEIAVTQTPIEPFSYAEKDDKGKKTGKTIYTDIINSQGYGAAFTYGKRYGLLSYWGIATADNDAMSGLADMMNGPEYERIAMPMINGMNACRTTQELQEWGVKNSSMVRNIIHPKAARIVSERFKELQDSLPAILQEDESQDVKTAKKKSSQPDLLEGSA